MKKIIIFWVSIILMITQINAQSVDSIFAEKITSLDSLKFYIESLTPISGMKEIKFMENVVKIGEIKQMQIVLYNFWKIRNDKNPEAEWNMYKLHVMMIERAYKTKIKHGFETDMGYIWLKYGAPNQVEDIKHEPNALPYIIWHFYHMGNQNNRHFLFYNPNLIGTEYMLLHSDAIGEINNPNWFKELSGRIENPANMGGYGSRAIELFKR